MAVIINELEVVPAGETPQRQPAPAADANRAPRKPAPPATLRAALIRRAERRQRVRAH